MDRSRLVAFLNRFGKKFLDIRSQNEKLQIQVDALRARNKELVIEVMQKSARISELEEQTNLWRTYCEAAAGQKGHNLCWMDLPRLLKKILGHTGAYPDPDNVTREEFEIGCGAFQDEMFGPKPIHLQLLED